MPPYDHSTKKNGLPPGPARKRREERRVYMTDSESFSTPMARPRRKLGSEQAGFPPAVTRQPVGGMATPRGKGGRRSANSESWVGRRYDIALPVTGAEMRLPALPIINGDWRILSGFLTFVFALIVYFFVFSPVFQVEVVEYRGLQRLQPADVNLMLDVSGKPIIAVSPSRLEERILEAFPDISDAKVKVILPAKLTITAVERQPVMIWKQGNTERWVDAEGMVFPMRGSLAVESSTAISSTVQSLITLQAENLPLPPMPLGKEGTPQADQANQIAAAAALGINGLRQIDPAIVSSVLALSTILPPDTELVYTSDHGLGWRDPKGWEVYFGSSIKAEASAELEQKQLVYQEIVKYLAANGLNPKLVSVENVHAPYYRMER